jgi:hypothetical protein
MMDIILFIGLFIAILLLLVAIAKYGIREKSYEDILKEKGIDASNLNAVNDAKKKVKKPKKTPQQQQSVKKQKVENESESESEEELVPVQDPFINSSIRNRKPPVPVVVQQQQPPVKSANNAKTNNDAVKSNTTSSVNSSQQPTPKPITKPNVVVASTKPQQKVETPITNGDHDDGGFIVHGAKKSKQQPHVEIETPVKQQSQPILKAAPVIEAPVVKQQQPAAVLVNGNHQQPTVSNGEQVNHIASKKELERVNASLIEKEKLIQSSNQTINKLKADLEK